MDHEFVVAVVVEAFEAGAVAADAVHARGGVAGELDPLRVERMELRMDHGARKGDDMPSGSIDPACGDAGPAIELDCGSQPVATGTQGDFT